MFPASVSEPASGSGSGSGSDSGSDSDSGSGSNPKSNSFSGSVTRTVKILQAVKGSKRGFYNLNVGSITVYNLKHEEKKKRKEGSGLRGALLKERCAEL